MTKKEATRRLRELTKSDEDLRSRMAANNEETREITRQYFGVQAGDEVEVVDEDFRYTKGIVLSVSGGFLQPGYRHYGTILVQPWNKNGKGNKLTRSHAARRQFCAKGILKVTRKAADVGPIAKLPRTTP